MSIPKIEKLNELISEHVDKTKKIIDTKIVRLTQPGENFGSEILKVDLVLNDEITNEKENLSVVAKLIPESEFFQKIFNVQVTFKNEAAFYDTVVPSLQEFQRKQGVTKVIDCFPKFYGARGNLENGNGKIDENAVLLLENLKIKGYINIDRHIGFDLATTKVLLREIAQFHAVPLALKLKDPETFEKKVKAYLACFHPRGPPPPDDGTQPLIDQLNESSETPHSPHLLVKLKESMAHFAQYPETFREPFSTVVHKDLWVNNVMVRFEEGQAVDAKLVDFQMYSYDSPATDLFFFLGTSVETKTLQTHFDDFLKYYHSVFIETLESLDCDTEAFKYELFLDEVAACIHWILGSTIGMLAFIVQGPKGGPPPSDDSSKPPKFELELKPEVRKKIWWLLEECDRRGWLNF